MQMIRRPAMVSLALALSASLLVAACGDDGDSDSADTTGGAATTGAATTAATDTTAAADTTVELTGEPVRVMVFYEGTGAVATPEVPEGAIAAAEKINSLGGIDGSPIEIVECNLANDPNAARECGNQAVSEGVVAVVGPVSANAGEYMPILEAAQIPVVGNVPAAAADFTSPASFPLYGGLVSASGGLADVLVSEAGATTVSLARIDLAAAAAIAIFANQALSKDGLAVNNDVSIPVGAPDMATYVAAVLEGGTNGVLVGLAGQDATNFIIALRQASPDTPISATTTEFAAVVEALGDAADGIYVTGFFDNPTTSPDDYAYYQDAMEAAGFDELTGFRTNSFSAVEVVAAVLAPLPEKTGAALYAALPTTTGLEVTLLPPLQFTTPAGAIPRVFNVCGYYQQLEGGEFITLSDGFIDMFTGEPC
jgi:ABC-type branched-subunit amino acid transport system substrate-binding protein